MQTIFLAQPKAHRNSVKNVLHEMLINHIESKVKIIHEIMPELFLENYAEPESGASGLVIRCS